MNPLPICFETICVQHRRFSRLLPYHEARLNRTRRELWNRAKPLPLERILEIPDFVDGEKHKCRITYGTEIINIAWEKYHPRPIERVRLVQGNSVYYAYKYRNRDPLNELYAQRGDCDDVLIVRSGQITDTSYANVALFDGAKWHTPKTPLLPGTQRAFLLDTGVILPREIRVDELNNYTHVKLFNAMLPWEEAYTLPISTLFTENHR